MAAPGSPTPPRCLPALDARLLASKQWCFWISGGMACYYAFLPVVYVELLGLSPADVGVLSGLSPLISALATPLWAAAADAWGCHRAVLLATLAASAGLHCLLPLCPRTMAWLVPLVLVSEAAGAPCVPLADAAIGLTLKVRAARVALPLGPGSSLRRALSASPKPRLCLPRSAPASLSATTASSGCGVPSAGALCFRQLWAPS